MAEVILTPKTVDEIEFYVSADGEKTGVSIRGLSRLAGVAHQSVSELLQSLSNFLGGNKTGSEFHKWLETLNLPSDLSVFAGRGDKDGAAVKVVLDTTATIILEWYAYESKSKNETAKNTYRKFSMIGFNRWVKQLTGFAEEDKTDRILSLIEGLVEEVKELKVVQRKYDNIKQTTLTLYPGLEPLQAEAEEGYILEEASEEDLSATFTLTEYLALKGISMDKGTKLAFARKVSEAFAVMKLQKPKKVKRKDKKGNLTQTLYGYRRSEFPVLDAALRAVLDVL